MSTDFQERLTWASERLEKLREAIGSVLVGQREVVDQVLTALLAGGHVLLEGSPGLGKTLLVKTLASCVDLGFSRIQFTPDLMPSDVIGTNVLIEQPGGGRAFSLHKGPIFGSVVLATENPIEQEGTYPLPEAQLDRFLLKVLVPDPGEEDLVTVMLRTTGHEVKTPSSVLSKDDVLALRTLCRDITVTEQVVRYAARLVKCSSPANPEAPAVVKRAIKFGAGVRAAQSLVLGAKAVALMAGRPHISFKDIAAVAKPALRHRLIRSFEGEADGVTTDAVIDALLEALPPRPVHVEQALAEARAK